jgi:formamidase
MSGLGGLNKTPDGVVIGLVQLQLPTIATKSDLAAQTKKICAMVAKARKGMSTMDLVVFPEYSLHGLSMDTNAELMSRLDGPEVASFRKACIDNRIWGCFSIMEYNADGNPYNSGLVITARCIRGCRSSRGSRAISAFLSAMDRTAAKSR